MSQQAIKLLFASDDPNAARQSDPALAGVDAIQVVGATSSPAELLNLVVLHEPDVVVIDYDAPGLDAAETTRAILHEDASIQVIMLSLVNDAEDIRQAMRAGARDYLVKPLHPGELVETVRWLIEERREYARMQAFVKQLRRAYDALFSDDKPIPPKVVAFLEAQVAQNPDDRLTQETLAVAYARNRDWEKLAPLAARLAQIKTG